MLDFFKKNKILIGAFLLISFIGLLYYFSLNQKVNDRARLTTAVTAMGVLDLCIHKYNSPSHLETRKILEKRTLEFIEKAESINKKQLQIVAQKIVGLLELGVVESGYLIKDGKEAKLIIVKTKKECDRVNMLLLNALNKDGILSKPLWGIKFTKEKKKELKLKSGKGSEI